LWDHVFCSFPRCEKGAVDIDVIQALHAIRGIAR
jgi:hypothetical protein